MISRPDDAFHINLVPDFIERVRNVLPVRQWDSVYSSLIWKLRRNPTFNAHELEAGHWMANLESVPSLFIFYSIDLAAKVIVLTDIRRKDSP